MRLREIQSKSLLLFAAAQCHLGWDSEISQEHRLDADNGWLTREDCTIPVLDANSDILLFEGLLHVDPTEHLSVIH